MACTRLAVQVRIVQAVALVALLHALTPLADPTRIQPGQLDEHYGETVRVAGRVAAVDTAGDVIRVEIASGRGQATVLTRSPPPPLGAYARVRGQPSPGQAGPILWAEGDLEIEEAGPQAPLALATLLDRAPHLEGTPVAVSGSWSPQHDEVVGPTGRLAVQPIGVAPEPGRAVLWGRLTYDEEHARYELEATGWRPWPSSPG